MCLFDWHASGPSLLSKYGHCSYNNARWQCHIIQKSSILFTNQGVKLEDCHFVVSPACVSPYSRHTESAPCRFGALLWQWLKMDFFISIVSLFAAHLMKMHLGFSCSIFFIICFLFLFCASFKLVFGFVNYWIVLVQLFSLMHWALQCIWPLPATRGTEHLRIWRNCIISI